MKAVRKVDSEKRILVRPISSGFRVVRAGSRRFWKTHLLNDFYDLPEFVKKIKTKMKANKPPNEVANSLLIGGIKAHNTLRLKANSSVLFLQISVHHLVENC